MLSTSSRMIFAKAQGVRSLKKGQLWLRVGNPLVIRSTFRVTIYFPIPFMRRTCYFANHNFKCMHETCYGSLNFDGSPYYSCVRRVYSLWVSYFIWGGFANVPLVKGNSFLQIQFF